MQSPNYLWEKSKRLLDLSIQKGVSEKPERLLDVSIEKSVSNWRLLEVDIEKSVSNWRLLDVSIEKGVSNWRLFEVSIDKGVSNWRLVDVSIEKGVSNWLTALLISDFGFELSKQHFWDAICLSIDGALQIYQQHAPVVVDLVYNIVLAVKRGFHIYKT